MNTTYMTISLDLPNNLSAQNFYAQLNSKFLIFQLNFCHALLPSRHIIRSVHETTLFNHTFYFSDPFNFTRAILVRIGVTDSIVISYFATEIVTRLINNLNNPPFAASKYVTINLFIVAVSSLQQEQESNIIDATFREALDAIPNVPATQESIKKLKELNEDDNNLLVSVGTDNNCTICQENLLFEGLKIVEMPCSHLFHKNCIVSWLKINHLCPLCRYSMPTTNEVAAAEN
ncbi:hypothetical protein CsatB_027448 [Cannabis sativa]